MVIQWIKVNIYQIILKPYGSPVEPMNYIPQQITYGNNIPQENTQVNTEKDSFGINTRTQTEPLNFSK